MADAVEPQGLESLIRTGEVDTVLAVFPDGLGRLLGKRVVGRYFLDHVLMSTPAFLFTVTWRWSRSRVKSRRSAARRHEARARPRMAPPPWLPKTPLLRRYTETASPSIGAALGAGQVERRPRGYLGDGLSLSHLSASPRRVRAKLTTVHPRPHPRIPYPPDLQGGPVDHPQPHGGREVP